MKPTVICIAGLLIIGCGKAPEPPVPVYPVSGIITFQGKPVVGADITFHNPEKKRSAFGRTNDRGEYQLTTFRANDGAVEGRALLTIVKIEPPVTQDSVADTESPEYLPPELMPARKPKKVKPVLPPRYASETTSGLVAHISSEGPNELNFDLSL